MLFAIPFVLLHHTQPLFPCFILSLKAVCPTHLFIPWLILWCRLIHFSHGPTCLCFPLIHSFTQPTSILICSQIILTILISLCSLCQDLATLSQKTTLSHCPNPMLERFLDRPQGISVMLYELSDERRGKEYLRGRSLLILVKGLR